MALDAACIDKGFFHIAHTASTRPGSTPHAPKSGAFSPDLPEIHFAAFRDEATGKRCLLHYPDTGFPHCAGYKRATNLGNFNGKVYESAYLAEQRKVYALGRNSVMSH
ncbi:hypothetical protein [Burkholderia metallica]|uniref:hypothetical protein n=1 Tax=Burkholderia metallica TaxID=488729 RepID=UPI001CF4590D|nr:hypothetical protein [Burkholderia metallica]MCA8023604.1 hypothetical protein [Burkholderia metallica]